MQNITLASVQEKQPKSVIRQKLKQAKSLKCLNPMLTIEFVDALALAGRMSIVSARFGLAITSESRGDSSRERFELDSFLRDDR
jgi:hypothetical protein